MRLIDADALIKACDGNIFTTDSVKAYVRASVAHMPTIDAVPMETWQELKETVLELRDNGGTATQKEVSDFLFNLMRILDAERKES